MKIIKLPTVIAISCLFVGSASATNTSTTGIIKRIDAPNDAIILVDGGVYTLGNEMEAETFKPGEKVKIVFVKKKGKMIASSVKAVH